MHDEEKELIHVEQNLVDNILATILFLNIRGLPLDHIKKMIYVKTDDCIDVYEEKGIREKWNEDKEIFKKVIEDRRNKTSMSLDNIKRFATEEEMKEIEEYFDEKRKWQGE